MAFGNEPYGGSRELGSLVNPDVQTLKEASATENTNRTSLAID